MKYSSVRKTCLQAFTLIELLLVITIISILAVVVLVSLRPAQRINDSQDTRRVTDVDSILTAIHEYIIDNNGTLPPSLPTGTERQLGTSATGCTIATGGCGVTNVACLDLSGDLTTYLQSIPVDPEATAAQTAYSVFVDSTTKKVVVRACRAEGMTILKAR